MIDILPLSGWLQIGIYFLVLFLCVKPLGAFMANVYEGRRNFMTPIMGWLERGVYLLCGIKADQEMSWRTYALHLIVFSVVSFFGLYALLRLQTLLPSARRCRSAR